MDEIDKYQQFEEIYLQSRVKQSRKPVKKMKKIGRCYNCEESIDNDLLFCDSDCRDDWEMRLKRR